MKQKIQKLKKFLINSILLTLPFNSTAMLANGILYSNNNSLLLAEAKGYREHEDQSENENDLHAIDHNWEQHYHTIRSIRLKTNGNLKISFCENVELLEGHIFADNIKYEVQDAYKVKKNSITWRINKKGTFDKGSSIFVDTKNFLGRPTEKDPNLNEVRSLERGCALPFLYLPAGVEVKGGDSFPLAAIGVIIGVGAFIGGGSSSGSRSTSSN